MSGLLNKWRVEGRLAPGIVADKWLNSKPLPIKELHGKVVLIDFWTMGCVDCPREFPHLKKWFEKYKAKGLVVIGVHSPEFQHQKSIVGVESEVKKRGLNYPIAIDNEHQAWNAYGATNWPSIYLVDKSGRVRWHHVGEGDYDAIETRMQQLLSEEPPRQAQFLAPPKISLLKAETVKKPARGKQTKQVKAARVFKKKKK